MGAQESTLPSGAAVRDILTRGVPSYSFEFFPPKTDEGEQTLFRTIRELETLDPAFVSVTYGAGGSTRDRTVRITGRIALETTLTPVAHLTCVGHSRAELRQIIGHYAGAGVRNLLALRGDPEAGPRADWVPHPEGLHHADELVELALTLGDFSVGVAAFPQGHPSSATPELDVVHLVGKFRAGADYAVTDFFFDADHYFRLRDEVASHGIDAPILPGVMPVTNVNQIQRFAELSGREFPKDLAARLLAVADDPAAIKDIGVEVASELCQTLLAGGAPGIHFYTLNRSTSTTEIFKALSLR